MFEIFTDDFMDTLNRAVNYFKKLTFIVDEYFTFDKPYHRPPRTIGTIREAIIHKKHIYFHCRSMLR